MVVIGSVEQKAHFFPFNLPHSDTSLILARLFQCICIFVQYMLYY